MKSKEIAIEVINKLDDFARGVCQYEFGLPMYTGMDDMIPIVTTAMQTYHDEGCVEFAEWKENIGNYMIKEVLGERGELVGKQHYTTTELLKLWKDEKGIV